MEVPLWLRHVVVPGLTDGEDHLAGLAEYVKGIRNVKRVELLPYHVLGGAQIPRHGNPISSGGRAAHGERSSCPMAGAYELRAEKWLRV